MGLQRGNFHEGVLNPQIALAPCPNSGGSGNSVETDLGAGRIFCLQCDTEGIWGDYDWYDLADCRRYRADLKAGLMKTLDELFACSRCGDKHELYFARWEASGCKTGCAREDSLFRGEPPPAPVPIPRMGKGMRAMLSGPTAGAYSGLVRGRMFDALVRRGWVVVQSAGRLLLTDAGDEIGRRCASRIRQGLSRGLLKSGASASAPGCGP